MLLGHSTYLKVKAGGDKSMSEKRESLEDAEGVVPQGRVIRRKLNCLNPNPQRWNRTLVATASVVQRRQEWTVQISRSTTFDW